MAHPKLRKVCFAIQNSGAKTPKYGHHLKLQGVTPGVCDAFCSFPSSTHHGLYIEFKSETGKTTKEQDEFITSVRELDYKVAVAHNIFEAMNAFLEHKRLSNHTPVRDASRTSQTSA